MDPPPPPNPNQNNDDQAQNEAHGVSPFSFFRHQVQLGHASSSAPPPHGPPSYWVAGTSNEEGTRAWMGGPSTIFQDYLEQRRRAYLEQQRQIRQRQAYLQHQRLIRQLQAYLAQQRQAYLAQHRQAYLEQQLLQAYLEKQQLLQAYLEQQQLQPVEVVQVNPPLVEVEHKVEDYLEQQQLQPVVEHEEALPVVEREEVPPVVEQPEEAPPVVEPEEAPPVEREVEVPSTVSSNPGLSGNLRSESEAIGPVESTVPCSDTSVTGTVKSTETIATNQSPSRSGTVCPAPSSTDIPSTQDTVTGENNADIANNSTNNADISEPLLDLENTSMFPTLGSQGPLNIPLPSLQVSVTKGKYDKPGRRRVNLSEYMSKPDEKSIKRSFSSGGRGNIPLPSNVQMTVAEREKEMEENRKPLQALKTDERKVDPKAFESVPQVLCKEGNDGSYIRISSKKESEGFYFQGQKDTKKEYAGKKQKAEKSNEFDKGEGSSSNGMQTSTGSMAAPKPEDPSSQAEDPSPPALGKN